MSFAQAVRRKVMAREPMASEKLPYDCHVDKFTIQTTDRDYMQVIRLTGASFESADDSQVNLWYKRLNVLLKNVASHNIAIWQHVVRRKENKYPDGEYPEGFAKDLKEKYSARLNLEKLRVNELYLTVVYRPFPNKIGNAMFEVMKKADNTSAAAEREEAVALLNKVVTTITRSLRRYDAEKLSVYKHMGAYYSEPMEFMSYLLNGHWRRFAIAQAPLRKLMPAVRPFFGSETIEIRTATSTSYGAMLGISVYPDETSPIFLQEILKAPFDFVLSQSFSFIKQESARNKMRTTQKVMESAQDDAKSQIDELDDALDDLASKRIVMGEHHFSLFVKAADLDSLETNVADAETALGDAGIQSAREDLAIIAAFWAQFPGQFKDRPRLSAINSKNFCGFAPLHNFPSGRLKNNHWGDALTMFTTTAGTPFYFSFHHSDPLDVKGVKIKDVGHTMFLGPTGSGKTATVAFLLSMLVKCECTCVLFTKDRDTEIIIRALGGTYYSIKKGVRTGWNFFALKDKSFIKQMVLYLCAHNGNIADIGVTDRDEIDEAVNAVMRLDPKHRKLGRVLDYLDKNKELRQRLQRWCYSRQEGRPDGENAWVFDNAQDELADTLGNNLITGFDVSEFLNIDELRTPINMYLFHLTESLIDGRRFAMFIAEFWKALSDPPFQSFVEDRLRTIRKLNGFVVLDSQSPNDALASPISHVLLQQTPNKILFPDGNADWDLYKKIVTEREFNIIKEEDPEQARSFLIKQGHSSVFASLDLTGMDFELDVLSSKKRNLDLMESLIAAYGALPQNWLPHFAAARRDA